MSKYIKKGLDSNWYKKAQIYVVYPNSFEDITGLAKQLPRIKDLGCNTVHILPLLKSPQVDAGFDVSDYLHVDEQFGGDKAFEKLLEKAKELDIKILIDIVLNHISDQHDWFKKAVAGDQVYQKYFTTTSSPNLVSKSAGSATYDFDGQRSILKIIFPEQAGPIPHWVKHKGLYYFHTFYPQQIDLNWNNPSVIIEMKKILLHWAKKGLSFRLDAIPFVAQDIKNNGVVTNKTFEILKELHKSVEAYGSIFMAEVTRSNKEILPFFGDKKIICELAYNFELMDACWSALLTGNIKHIKSALSQKIPKHAQWVTFLRSHDELMLKSTDSQVNKQLYSQLSKKGLPYKNNRAVAGRLASFLEGDAEKILFAHILLASLPGSPAIYYGDEFGVTNNFTHMDDELAKKLPFGITVPDARDINRGKIDPAQLMKDKPSAKLAKDISALFKLRQTLDFSNPKFSLRNDILKITYSNWAAILNFGEKSIQTNQPTIMGEKTISAKSAAWVLSK